VENRAESIKDEYGLSLEEAMKFVVEKDKERADYYNYYTFGDWGIASTYDLCINSAVLGIEGTADYIIEFITKAGKL
jgi:cytidylate kinase